MGIFQNTPIKLYSRKLLYILILRIMAIKQRFISKLESNPNIDKSIINKFKEMSEEDVLSFLLDSSEDILKNIYQNKMPN